MKKQTFLKAKNEFFEKKNKINESITL